ncbi:hypothetical protein HDU76_011885 [Blyttiomyces sp. JEL0837]|nr:hypothetical protein HDU76_011885 [Blyttiomyces sp. JEL0837]
MLAGNDEASASPIPGQNSLPDANAKPKKIRRAKPKEKLDVANMEVDTLNTRLLSPAGMSALKSQVKKLHIGEKHNELKDLKKIVNMYQLWGHNLFPSLKFRQFVEATEKLCRDKKMKIWREEQIRAQRGGVLAPEDGPSKTETEAVERDASPIPVD